MKITKENVEKVIRKLIKKYDDDFNAKLSDEDLSYLKSEFSKDPAIAFDNYKDYVEFRFDGEIYELIHEEWVSSFMDLFRNKFEKLNWNWEFYNSSIIHFYKGGF